MPKLEIRPTGGVDIKVPKFTVAQMRQLGDLADDLIDRRVDSDTPRNIFGEPRPALREKYARRKAREGRRPVRDMHRTGQTLAAKNVLGTFEREGEVGAIVGIRGSTYFWRGMKAQDADPWFGLTSDEEQAVRQMALGMFEQQIAATNAR